MGEAGPDADGDRATDMADTWLEASAHGVAPAAGG